MLPTLASKGINVPTYDRTKLKPRLVHMGLGHFHRAHYLTYLSRLLDAGIYDGGVLEVDLPAVPEGFVRALEEQDYLYSVLDKATDGTMHLHINGPIIGYANAKSDPEKVLAWLVTETTQLITLTITERGYYQDDVTQQIDWKHPDIIHDLQAEGRDWPVTATGFLSLALSRRFVSGKMPVTIMSCDNVPENGHLLQTCILQFCKKKYPQIVPWIESSVAFPCTMVDRITPGTTKADIEEIERKFGIEDSIPVHCEDFIQWIIEDRSVTPLPPFEKAGAVVESSVIPYEKMKMRLLNGAHSVIGYLSALMGLEWVDEGATDPLIGNFVRNRYMKEIIPTLDPIKDVDFSAYCDKLISRFANKAIRDKISRLCLDGRKKMASFIFQPLMQALQEGKECDSLIFAVAAWARYLKGKTDAGMDIVIEDDFAEPLHKLALNAEKEPQTFLEFASASNLSEAQWAYLSKTFVHFLDDFRELGAQGSLSRFEETHS